MGRLDVWPVALHVLVSNLTVLLLVFHKAALTAADVHSLKELFLAFHALELNIGVASFWLVHIRVRTFYYKCFGLNLYCLQFQFKIQDGIRGFSVAGLKDAEALIESLFVVEQFTHMLHVLKVIHVGKGHVYVPDIVLVFVFIFCVGVDQLGRFFLENVFDPGIIDTRKFFYILSVRFLVDFDGKVLRLDFICIDLSTSRFLELLERKYRTPKPERDKQVKEHNKYADTVLCH